MRLLTVAALLLAATATFAQNATPVTGSVNTRVIGAGEWFEFTITAQGTRVGRPQLPDDPDLTIDTNSRNHRQSSRIQIVNGRVTQTSTQSWTYLCKFESEGDKDFPPVTIQVDGKDYMTQKVKMTVTSGSNVQQQQIQRPTQRAPGGNRRQLSERPADLTLEDLVYLECEVSDTEVYEGEAVMLTVRFGRYDGRGVSITGIRGNSLSLPSVEGFYEGDVQRAEREVRRSGNVFVETSFSRPLFATRSGTMTVPTVEWVGRVSAPTRFGRSREDITKRTNTINIRVKPLPERPADFSGAVGQFRFLSRIGDGPWQQSVPTELTLRISGSGNADAISRPDLPDLPWCHLSEPEIATRQTGGPFEFEKLFTYTLTPTEIGLHTIPAIDFVFFAPELGTFKTTSSKPIEIQVDAAEDSGNLVVVGGTRSEQRGVLDVLGSDIVTIIPEHRGLNKTGVRMPVDVALAGAPPVAFAACALLLRHRRRLREDTQYARTRRARSRSMKRLRRVASSDDPCEELFKALTGFLGDKLNLTDAGLTSNDAVEVLREHGLPEPVRTSFEKILRSCERQRYAGVQLGDNEVRALTEAAAKAMDDFDDARAEAKR